MEKNCKWFFGNEGGIDIGPNDPIHQIFKGNPYYSIVREAIQNSLDAVNDDRYPVKVTFEYFDLERSVFSNFFDLEENIKQSLDFFKTNHQAKILFGDMLLYLNGNEQGKKKLKISCLRIADYNTKGMYYEKGDTESPFYAFLKAAGVSAKMTAGSGGSFGFGKGAYYALSPVKTVIVSSRDANNNVYFEGATRLTTHNSIDGQKRTAYGFYDNNDGEPVVVEDSIPEIFRRTETGTDINIMGLWDVFDRNTLMIKSVLNNFWLAIHENKLIVSINDVTISKENLEQIIDEYFKNELESGNASDIELWNPKPYYKAVKYVEANDQFRFFPGDLPNLGKVKLYVYLEKGLPDRTSFFRKPKMVVFKRTNRAKVRGYAAVFICESDAGNEILRMMENPAHNEWRKENYPQDEGRTSWKAKRAEKELSDFVNEKLDSLSTINTSKKVTFLGLEDYLSIPEDLLEKDDESDLKGDTANNKSGLPSKDLASDETGMQTTNLDAPVLIKPNIKPKTEVKEEGDTEITEEGTETVTLGGENEGSGGERMGSGDGTLDKGERSEEENNNSRVLVKVKLNVAAQVEQNILYHNLIISADRDINNAELEFLVGADNDKDDGISIVSTDNGEIEHNKLKKVLLSNGRNQIKVQFADNLKHSIKLKAYEIQ